MEGKVQVSMHACIDRVRNCTVTNIKGAKAGLVSGDAGIRHMFQTPPFVALSSFGTIIAGQRTVSSIPNICPVQYLDLYILR